jgi:dihydrofolate reductase
MSEVVMDHLVSLDGYCSGANDEIDWFGFDEESLEWSRQLLRAAKTIVMGRRTFEVMESYWPTPAARKEEPYISERMTELPKLVFSRSRNSSSWVNTEFVDKPVGAVIRELKRGKGGYIEILGSSNIVAQLWKEGLVDEMYVRVQPVVLGKGRPLFPEQGARQPLELKESRLFKSGVAALHYSVLTPPTPAVPPA